MDYRPRTLLAAPASLPLPACKPPARRSSRHVRRDGQAVQVAREAVPGGLRPHHGTDAAGAATRALLLSPAQACAHSWRPQHCPGIRTWWARAATVAGCYSARVPGGV
eukprot:scaffold3348_cov379-Prasinococcus_capsulatus_cf.AAC.6